MYIYMHAYYKSFSLFAHWSDCVDRNDKDDRRNEAHIYIQ